MTEKSLSFKRKLVFAYQRLSYQWLLPLLSHLPFFLSESITTLRGYFNAVFDLEWRSIAIDHKYIKAGTYRAISQISPDLTPSEVKLKTYQRFVTFAREELDAAMFPHRNLQAVFQRSIINGFQQWARVLDSGKGLVVLTCHYDCFTMGVTLMAMKGRKVNLMTSNVVENAQLSPYVQDFYAKKYQAMEGYFNGGKAVHVEDSLRFFYQALANNEIVFILADLPAPSKDKNSSIVAPFINNNYHLAPGPFRMALKTNSPMAAFYCLNKGGGKYHIQCSEVYDPHDQLNSVAHLYDFLQQPIKRHPEKWFVSELLNGYLSDE